MFSDALNSHITPPTALILFREYGLISVLNKNMKIPMQLHTSHKPQANNGLSHRDNTDVINRCIMCVQPLALLSQHKLF